MRRIIFILGAVLVLVVFINKQSAPALVRVDNKTPPVEISPQSQFGVFVPYWNTDVGNNYQNNPINTDKISKSYYFGVTFDENGNLIINEPGFKKLKTFNSRVETETYLVIRIINSDLVNKIIKNRQLAQKIANTSVTTAKKNNFKGVVIDLEYSNLPTKKTRDDITNTLTIFSRITRENNLLFEVLVYGDSFYRDRPYNIKKISGISDTVVVMAYDFHKSRSLPGPLFPYEKNKFDYSFSEMINDFLQYIPVNKLSIAFGLYGYSWKVDDKERPMIPGVAKPYKAIAVIKNNCYLPKCSVYVNTQSNELKIKTDNDDHSWSVIYSETPESIKTKIDLAIQKNIYKFAIWAYGYY